ncbi:MAG: pseudomurein-binding protein [Methanobrevibacter sp.]|nr:pseudomurein-binding protein [Methanobrevibacter sp.]
MNYLTLKEYREMVDSIIDFKNENGVMPEYAHVNNRRISRKSYSDMIERVNKFILEMGRSPKTVEIN